MPLTPNLVTAQELLTGREHWVRNENTPRRTQRYNYIPVGQVVERFHALPLTVDELKEVLHFYNVCNLKIVFQHPNWTTDALVEVTNAMPYLAYEIVRAIDNLEYFKKLHDEERNHYLDNIGLGLHHSSETLAWALKVGCLNVVGNHKLPIDAIEEWVLTKDINDSDQWWEAMRVANKLAINPNVTTELLGWIGAVWEPERILTESRRIGYRDSLGVVTKWIIRDKFFVLLNVAQNPLTPATTLTNVYAICKSNDTRLALARHPNTPRDILVKISKSQVRDVRLAALARL